MYISLSWGTNLGQFWTDYQLKHPFSVISESGTIYKVTITIKDSMKDLKFKKKLLGIGGGDSIICETRPAEWKDVAKIREGFPITRA